MIQKLANLPRCVSFPRYIIRRQLASLATTIGRCDCMVDVGSGRASSYKDLFDHKVYIGMDRFEYADVIGDAEVLPLISGKVDLILCTEVLEHLPEPHRALAEMRRVLVPGGFLIVTVPLIWGEHDYVDYQRWTEAGLRRILQSAGFEIQALKRRGGIFTMLGCMITQVPHQVFGALSDQRNWLLRVLYVSCWLITVPIPWVFAPLDRLDRTKAFTVGYSVLCRKS
jgi:SAM-dependent methyltransferase